MADSLRRPSPWPLVIGMLACLPFLPGLSGGFLFDDLPNIVKNGALHLRHLTLDNLLLAAYSFQPGHGSRALAMLSFALDFWRAGGLDPFAFKTTNLLLHGLSAVALACMFRQLLVLARYPVRQAGWYGAGLALLWAIHPLQVSTVLYVVQRMQMLGTFFVIVALWSYLRFRQAQILGERSRHYALLTVLAWAFALASKEDAALFPAYTLLLELTVLRFRAAAPSVARAWHHAYRALFVCGLAVYALVIVPHFWHWDDYPGRTFNTPERLLTQGRVLMMYLGQAFWPSPAQLPFFYDDLPVSRGLLQPWTTLPSLLLVAGLLALGWCLRQRRPVFALGLLWFFAGHFITSNVIGLELAFEHRNSFPLVGLVLAVGDLWAGAFPLDRARSRGPHALAVAMMLLLGLLCHRQATLWGDNLRLGQALVELRPQSARAYVSLGGMYFDRYKITGDKAALEHAIAVNQAAIRATHVASPYANVVLYKTIAGTVTPADWEALDRRLQTAPMTIQNRMLLHNMLDNVGRGLPLDAKSVARIVEIFNQRIRFSSTECLQAGQFYFNKTDDEARAFHYLQCAVERAPEGSSEISNMLAALRKAGMSAWADRLQAIERGKPRTVQ